MLGEFAVLNKKTHNVNLLMLAQLGGLLRTELSVLGPHRVEVGRKYAPGDVELVRSEKLAVQTDRLSQIDLFDRCQRSR